MWCARSRARRLVSMNLLRLLLCLVRVCRFTSLVVTTWSYKSRWLPLHTPTSSLTMRCSLLTSFPAPEKKERENRGKRRKKRKRDSWDLESVASLSLSSHGGTRLDPFQDHTGSPAKPCEPGVYDGGGARGLPCTKGPRVPYTRGRIRGELCSFLRAEIQCAIASFSPLVTVALRFGAA
jgi:hypothetical protein